MNSAKTMNTAVATAVIVLPLFAPQPLVGAIGASLHFPHWAVNTPATVTLLGYAAGLFLVTPLIDLFELRRLVVTTVVADAVALTVAALALLVLAALILDFSVVCDQTLGRRAINLIRWEERGRVNGLYTGLFFLGGTIGSVLAGFAWALGGWSLVCGGGIACGTAALLLSSTETRGTPVQGSE